jgi:hypothetical protein
VNDQTRDQPPALTTEQQVLIAVRHTLTTIIRELTPPPGMRHPLSEPTINDLRQCLMLIAAREKEIADVQGRGGERPYFADEPQGATLVPMANLKPRQN